MNKFLSTRDVCDRVRLTESRLRHALRRHGAPRPALHPTVRVFLWTERDVEDLVEFLRRERDDAAAQQARSTP